MGIGELGGRRKRLGLGWRLEGGVCQFDFGEEAGLAGMHPGFVEWKELVGVSTDCW